MEVKNSAKRIAAGLMRRIEEKKWRRNGEQKENKIEKGEKEVDIRERTKERKGED